jgi:LmbE family N-acetylglucosaminyl deacetylase
LYIDAGLRTSGGNPLRVLVVSPHADDETLGAGGVMARYAAEGHDVFVAVMTGHGDNAPHPLWPREVWSTVREEARRAYAILRVKDVLFFELPAVQVSEQPLWQVNRAALDAVQKVRPDVLYIPFLYDLHRDHRELFHAFSVAWRPSSEEGRAIKQIYAYETQSETHWSAPYLEPGFAPHVWVDISAYLDQKIEALKCFHSQIRPGPDTRSIEAIRALAAWRGSQMNMAAAEAFVAIRLLR